MNALITFRPDASTLGDFNKMLATLGVAASDLARRAYELGVRAAFSELAEKERREAERKLERLKTVPASSKSANEVFASEAFRKISPKNR